MEIARGGGGGRYGAVCSVTSKRFESVSGALQLAAHCAAHAIHAVNEVQRRDDVPALVQRLRLAEQEREIRAALAQADSLSEQLPDSRLERAVLKAEARLELLLKQRARHFRAVARREPPRPRGGADNPRPPRRQRRPEMITVEIVSPPITSPATGSRAACRPASRTRSSSRPTHFPGPRSASRSRKPPP